MIKNPKISVAKPGTIKSNAPKAIAAPEIISYAGVSFLIIVPPTRKLIFGKISTKFKDKKNGKNHFIDGEFEDIEDDDDRKI